MYEPLEKVKNKFTNEITSKNELSLSTIIDLKRLSADNSL